MAFDLYTRPPVEATSRVGQLVYAVGVSARFVGGRTKRLLLPPHYAPKYSGHAPVTGSLIRGLKTIQSPVHLNPWRPEVTASRAGVLAGAQTLAVALRALRCELVVGPNICVLPTDLAGLLMDSNVHRILVPSDWVARLWARDLPSVAGKLRVWAAGVDYNAWHARSRRPAKLQEQRHRALIYKKTDQAVVDTAVAALQSCGWDYAVITYGAYRPRQYLRALQASDALVYCGSSESQGIALHESWAADVPTFVFQPANVAIQGDQQRWVLVESEFSPAPFLTANSGALWRDQTDLASILRDFRERQFTPRASTINDFSDEASARKYMALLKSP